jgi:3-hydroxyisobutyrate dehydrogenase
MNVAFIGLGNMGRPMALNLVKAGYRLTVFDVSPAPLAVLREAGAAVAASAADAVRGAEVVISMLPTSAHVRDLYLGEHQLLSAVSPDALLIDCSTIAPQTSRETADAAAARGNAMIDAPVSGGTAGATAGTLTFIVGGAAAAVERARPLLDKMGKNVFHAGGSGSGQLAKICNNMLLGIQMIGTSEALNLGVANGLDPKVLSEIMSKSSGRNWALEVYNPWPGVMSNAPASKAYQGGFGTDLMLKDLGLAQETALGTPCATPLGALARQLYLLHSQDGCGALDFSSIIDMFRHAGSAPK